MENYGIRLFRQEWFVLIFILGALPSTGLSHNDPKVQIIGSYTVVLDPGHGGRDQGARGVECTEKEVNLKVSQMVSELLKSEMPNSRILLTRSSDQAVGLRDRAKLANQNKADLFISIHCNSHHDHQVRGTESYVMGLHKTDENLLVAKTENAVFLEEEGLQTDPEPQSAEAHILFSHMQEQNLWESIRLASNFEKNAQFHHPGGSRGVRQAGFMVLHQVVMPAVLLELGYISNPEEEKLLCSEEGQARLAQMLVASIREYFISLETLAGRMN